MTGILNRRLVAEIQFHNTLHEFQMGRGTGNAYFESKLIHQLVYMREDILYNILLDKHRAYDALDRNLCLDVLVV